MLVRYGYRLAQQKHFSETNPDPLPFVTSSYKYSTNEVLNNSETSPTTVEIIKEVLSKDAHDIQDSEFEPDTGMEEFSEYSDTIDSMLGAGWDSPWDLDWMMLQNHMEFSESDSFPYDGIADGHLIEEIE